MLIVVGGMIGVGKTTAATLVSERLGSDLFKENVDNNDILPLFYTASEDEQDKYRYPFLLQLDFLNSRFQDIKNALVHPNNVLDRSIYEDWYFAKVNMELGSIRPIEFKIYEKLLANMMEELADLPKKAPDLMIYLHADFDTILKRIGLRGRSFEQDDSLIEYYHTLWSGYDEWVNSHYKASDVLRINMDEYNLADNPDDQERFIQQVKESLTKQRQG